MGCDAGNVRTQNPDWIEYAFEFVAAQSSLHFLFFRFFVIYSSRANKCRLKCTRTVLTRSNAKLHFGVKVFVCNYPRHYT